MRPATQRRAASPAGAPGARAAAVYDREVSSDPTVVHDPAETRFDPGHEGEALGGILVKALLEGIRDMGKTVIPTCPFAAAYIKRHPEWVQSVAPAMRGQFV